MLKFIRINEYKVLAYRLLLAYLFYFVARVLFYLYNCEFLQVDTFVDFISICYHGLAFDTSAILYVNLLFILFSILPLWKNTTIGYQKKMFYLYFITNIFAYAFNFLDLVYYRFSLTRTTMAAIEVVRHETNKSILLANFLINYWHVFLLFVVCVLIWIFLYGRVKIKNEIPIKQAAYFGFSFVFLLLYSLLTVGGIRGGNFQKSTRPINLVDAAKYVKKINHADIILNTPFAIIRTLFTNSFKKPNYVGVNDEIISKIIQPIKQYHNNPPSRPNIVVLILESYGREYIGAFNTTLQVIDHKTHTPFLDSLSQQSLIFPNAFANGRQSIHGMSSILAGIPAFKDAFTSSPYPKQKIESLVSTLESEGYNSSFFHGAANGSMGFLGFGNILGIDHYYGRTEFNNDAEYDGFWGIWDEPFLQFMKQTLDIKKTPFLATAFTVSSHEPYIIPKKYNNKFKEGELPIHKCIAYTDFALERFFKEAKKSAWFENTIFVLVADHCNQVFYEEYKKPISRYAVPIIIYKPNSKYIGKDNDLAQQIDIYPTILDIIGYQKPFRSWGRSLIDKKSQEPFVINSTGEFTQFLKGNYICIFDGRKAIGFYDKNDRGLVHNLIANRNQEMNQMELQCKAFIQDYMDRIIDKKLTH